MSHAQEMFQTYIARKLQLLQLKRKVTGIMLSVLQITEPFYLRECTKLSYSLPFFTQVLYLTSNKSKIWTAAMWT